MLSVAELKTVLRTHHLRLTKRLGQHHLIDARLIQRLMDRAHLLPSETVIEIGAGLGALTDALADHAGRVIAVEVDRKICTLLAQRFAVHPRVEVVCQDILNFPWQDYGSVAVVGAIPYHITSPILVALTEHRRHITRTIVVIQAEVADRVVAVPGTKAYGRLSLLIQYGWQIQWHMPVPRSAFFPQPTVDSVVLELRARPRPPRVVTNEVAFFQLVKAAFAHRRKTLVNSLHEEAWMERPTTEALLHGLGLSPMVRAERLSLEQFVDLANLVVERKAVR